MIGHAADHAGKSNASTKYQERSRPILRSSLSLVFVLGYDGASSYSDTKTNRCLVLLCSAVVLNVTDEEGAYIVAAWSRWLGPLVLYETVRWWRTASPAALIDGLRADTPLG